ncbi:glutamyl-tRNA reductase [Sinimarinibacterium sp. CAU 1509]|uniref:glutamyl-tRNA reductase n=1 Tax=Sinimarinibacterium sp. CAU 1509 TaxID=2562283 RepID=UPI0010ABAF78|nr:glutamyl-tRNA reductase [Sinimarinibacterium sp. CAU 1509]TJY61873.1 glutamyl-tRNA reductase [Sinimarinibacterium sp. CAU 1509]
MALVTLGLSHHRAPVEARERLAFTEADLPAAVERLHSLPGVEEAAILSTCNRTEIMTVTSLDEESRLIDWWRRERQAPDGYIEKFLYTHRDQGSVTHSLRVASGLDSLVVGEPQILGQMKQTYTLAAEVKTLGPVLGRLFQHAFAVAKLVRSQTQIGAHPVSVAYAALQMARRIFTDMQSQTALLIGAGEMMQLVGRHLHQHGVGRIVVANRSLERAEKLAREVHGYAISLDDLPNYLADADLVVSSTAARGFLIDRAAMQRVVKSRRRKPVFMIDLAVPRDIDPAIAELEDIYLYSIDDLRAVIADNMKLREEAARQAEVLVQSQAQEFARWLESRDAGGTIQQLRARARSTRDEVLEKARKRLASGQSPEAVMAFLADTLSNKLLHAPSHALRRADAVEQAMLLNAARRLFDLPEE